MNFEKNDGKNHRIFILNLPNVSRVLLVDFLGEVFSHRNIGAADHEEVIGQLCCWLVPHPCEGRH